jgi:hypothetical protein
LRGMVRIQKCQHSCLKLGQMSFVVATDAVMEVRQAQGLQGVKGFGWRGDFEKKFDSLCFPRRRSECPSQSERRLVPEEDGGPAQLCQVERLARAEESAGIADVKGACPTCAGAIRVEVNENPGHNCPAISRTNSTG